MLLNNKEYLYFYDRLNKIMFPDNIDLRLKTLIINPFEMFKYLKNENEFIDWVFFLEKKCYDLYIVPVSLNIYDLKILGSIIFALVNIKEQNLNDTYYNKLLLYSIQYPKLILINSRINLKVNPFFDYLDYNINLGILAKHILLKKNNSCELYTLNDINDNVNNINNECSKTNDIFILKNQINQLTRKYLKYKKKYNASKNKR